MHLHFADGRDYTVPRFRALGGSIGRSAVVAVALAKEGATLAVTGRNREALAETVAQIEAVGTRAISESVELDGSYSVEVS
jgi:NADP-dependent 3-hydroxy acid dehydrogenase YdfG